MRPGKDNKISENDYLKNNLKGNVESKGRNLE